MPVILWIIIAILVIGSALYLVQAILSFMFSVIFYGIVFGLGIYIFYKMINYLEKKEISLLDLVREIIEKSKRAILGKKDRE
jgi:membrane protein implicated in regulation of membrane protease activity